MAILVIDDFQDSRVLVKRLLERRGYDVIAGESAQEALRYLTDDEGCEAPEIDLILMDIVMPGIDGIEACRIIKDGPSYQDVPVIMLTANNDVDNLEIAFDAGAVDYISKPFKEIELLVRVRSALRLKYETDRRKQRETELLQLMQQLEQVNQKLKELSSLDGLTGIANRRHFDELFQHEWKRASRDGAAIAVIMIDIDFFKKFNDTYGHQSGDDCLRQVARTAHDGLKRPADLAARYGGEEFIIVLPNTDLPGAYVVAETIRSDVEMLKIPHVTSQASKHVTISAGIASVYPKDEQNPEALIKLADKALYEAKNRGKNRVVWIEE